MTRNEHHIEILRIVSCFAVVIMHVSASNQYSIAISSVAWRTFNVFDNMARFGVPCFVMISGMFLLSPDKSLSIRDLYLKRIPRIAFVWLLWELFYAVTDFIWRGDNITLAAFGEIAKTALTGHYHLWYLPMLIGLYVATPIIRAVTEKRDRKLCAYFIALFLVFGVLKPTVLLLELPEVVKDFINKIPLTLFNGYAGYYMLGYYLNTYSITRRVKLIIYALGIVGAVEAVIVEQYFSVSSGSTSGIVYDFMSIPVVLMSTAVFLLFKDLVAKIRFSEKSLERIKRVSSCTFGIYLLHAFVIERVYNLGLTTLSMNPAISVLLISGVGFFVSWIAIYFIRKIPALRKYLM